MSRSWWTRTVILVLLILVSLFVLMPTVVEMVAFPEVKEEVTKDVDEDAPRKPPLPEWYTNLQSTGSQIFALWPTKTLSLGLDLQGGLMMRYSVDINSAVDAKMTNNASSIKMALGEQGIGATYVIDHVGHEITFTFSNPADLGKLNDDFLMDYPMLAIAGEDGATKTLGLRSDYFKESEESAIKQAVEIIRDRIDELGVAQPNVRVESGGKIAVELPGLSKSRVAAAKRLISTTAVLTFKLVAPREEAIAVFTGLNNSVTADSKISVCGASLCADDIMEGKRVITSGKEILKTFVRAHETEVPNGREIDYEKVDLRERSYDFENISKEELAKLPTRWRMRLVRTDMPELSGENVETAYPASNPETGMPYVALKLDRRGGDVFYGITKEHVGDQLAILMDDQLVSDPVIRSEIPGGNVSIEMGRGNRQQTLDDVNNLVVSLRSGALPAPIHMDSETLVGPSMGKDAIDSGMTSLAIGFCLVFVFMCYYYKKSGLIAAFALALNVLFIMAGMATMGAALTMPGIAGIVLTVGMSVDANVIVFERIREELRASETPRKAILIGYEKALSTILDSNITTAIAAVVLMNFGSGPVKGFAVTLLLGIVCTVYTAFFVTRTIFERQVRLNSERISI